jgi:ketosteroid isomerase-like protein
VDVKALGSDAAREIGTFTLKTKGDKPQEVAGKYVVVWEKTGGQWKLDRHLEYRQIRFNASSAGPA